LDCSVKNATAELQYTVYGGITEGTFEPNPDIAGIGVSRTNIQRANSAVECDEQILYAFFSIAALALVTSSIYLILQITPALNFTGIHARVHKAPHASR